MSKIDFDGKMFLTEKCGYFKVINYRNAHCIDIRFVNTGFETNVQAVSIKRGNIVDRLLPSVYGVGVLDSGKCWKDGKRTKEYRLWSDMLKRCYDESYHKRKPSYVSCSVSEDFKNLRIFSEWCNKQVGFDNRGWCLDKDILVKGNKVYSPETCCFVPNDINGLFIKRCRGRGKYVIGVSYNKPLKKYHAQISRGGVIESLGYFATEYEAYLVYKENKESYIKYVAEQWKGIIDNRVYKALIDYEVSIED